MDPFFIRLAITTDPTNITLIPLSTNTCFFLAVNQSFGTESWVDDGFLTAAPGTTTLCNKKESSQ
ncbi:hypothetical protein HanIR_Chr07g0327871 [Helianthus annuus]|nr:hypothetical protein HanIR_Chr07g0327871 [Helianthus annuus]